MSKFLKAVMSIGCAAFLLAVGSSVAQATAGGPAHSFSEAVNLRLVSDADYGRFIDPQIVGADRKLALFFMRSMPANKRGDFVYVSRKGKVLSNRLGVAFSISFMPGSSRLAMPSRSEHRVDAISKIRRGGTSPGGEPASSCEGGACIRTFSTVGINAMYGYAIPPCDMALQSNESGNMYFNAYAPNGGDVTDAGLGTNISSSTRYNPSTNPEPPSVAFVNLGPPYGYNNNGWANRYQTYPCGQPVGMMFGTMPSPNQNYSLLMTGVPSYDPTQMTLPPETTTWNPGAWDFWDTNSLLLSPSGMWNGFSSNCTTCSVAAMLTLAQPELYYDGSCYGYCTSAGGDGAWYELVGGQLVSECDTPPQQMQETCTIEYTPSWQGGNYTDLSSGFAFSTGGNQQQIAEGINLNYYSNTSATPWQFQSPLPDAPPTPCTTDSDNQCAVVMSSTQNGACNTGQVGPKGQPIIVYGHQYVYDIFAKSRMLELLGSATYTQTVPQEPPCTFTDTWSPADPRITYNDPNLP